METNTNEQHAFRTNVIACTELSTCAKLVVHVRKTRSATCTKSDQPAAQNRISHLHRIGSATSTKSDQRSAQNLSQPRVQNQISQVHVYDYVHRIGSVPSQNWISHVHRLESVTCTVPNQSRAQNMCTESDQPCAQNWISHVHIIGPAKCTESNQ